MWRALILSCAIALAGVGQGSAQQNETQPNQILVIDIDQLFNQSLFGQRVERDLEADGRELASENARIEGELREEEQILTKQRAEMNAEDFRKLADAFDEKVQNTRAQQLEKTQTLNARADARRVTFLNAAAPILQNLMRDAGAVVLVERRNVVLHVSAVDITTAAIAQLDIDLGDGSQPATSGE